LLQKYDETAVKFVKNAEEKFVEGLEAWASKDMHCSGKVFTSFLMQFLFAITPYSLEHSNADICRRSDSDSCDE
jgi:hypothetical protein